jgi:hypothetical protein
MNEMDIREHMEVVDSDGEHVGTVDHLEGDATIKLTRGDSGDGMHHFIPVDWVESVDDVVHLSKPADEVMRQWKAA